MAEISAIVPVIGAGAIARRVEALAMEIEAGYGDEPVCMIGVLKGAAIFMADLARHIGRAGLELDFVQLSSYGAGTESSQEIVLKKDIGLDIAGRHVLVVEDIVDSGLSMRFLLERLARRNPRSLRLAALVEKLERRIEGVRVDYTGFIMQGGFLVGYGMDYAERFRALPDICEIVFDR